MTTSKIRPEKKAAIDTIKQSVDSSSIIIFTDYRGLNVSSITELRQKLKDENASMNVCKNTMTRIALQELNIDCPAEMLAGPSALISAEDEPVKVSKVVVDYIKKNDSLNIKGGIFENAAVGSDVILQLAKLPGREELIAKSVGLIKSPITNLVICLSSPIQGLINVLTAVKEKK
jgi:large subunit ribosomal protein L10